MILKFYGLFQRKNAQIQTPVEDDPIVDQVRHGSHLKGMQPIIDERTGEYSQFLPLDKWHRAC